jgi:Rrf2 family iron-sulfur cluster assembly transcriptional regulator
MILTSKTRYAIMAISQIASVPEGNTVPLSKISLQQNIPHHFLEQIFLKLKTKGIVNAMKGPGGGYFLTSNQKKMKILEVIDAMEENTQMTRCIFGQGCLPGKVKCNTHEVWKNLSDHIRQYFAAIAISDLTNYKPTKECASEVPDV